MEQLPNGFWKVRFNDESRERVQKRLESFTPNEDKRYEGWVAQSIGRKQGLLGEEAFRLKFPDAEFQGEENSDYDFLYKGKTIEVKSFRVKMRNDTLYDPDYVWLNEGKTKKPDLYVFVKVHESCQWAILLGFIPFKRFFEIADYRTVDDPKHPFPNGRMKANTYTMESKHLGRFK